MILLPNVLCCPVFFTAHAGFIPHPRLIEQLNAGVSCKLTLVTAPLDLYQTEFAWYYPPTEVEPEGRSGEYQDKP